MNLVEGVHLSVRYKGSSEAALKNVSFQIPAGRTTLFLGKSGSGKTSLLKCIAQINTQSEGQLLVSGHPITQLSRKERASQVGFVAQHFNLFPHMTAFDNCCHPQIHVFKKSPDEAKEVATALLDHLGIGTLMHRYPKELSGGQQQRLAIARAMCMQPKVLLLDEPTSALDPDSTKQLISLLHKLANEGLTLAISTHDMNFAKQMLDRAYFMTEGQIVESIETKDELAGKTEHMNRYLQQG